MNFGVLISKLDEQFVKENNNPNKIIKSKKEAAIDVGLNNLLSLYIDDKESKSLIFSGKKYKAYNNSYNKHIAKIQSKIDLTEDKKLRNLLKKEKQHITEKRKRKIDNEFHQISSLLIKYLKEKKVKRLILSKNLASLKNNEKVCMLKKTKQQFIQIPFIKLLDILALKALLNGIEIQYIDEAFTSISSCLTEDVNINRINLKDKKKELKS